MGRLIPHKGVDVLLRAVAADPRLHADIVGDGTDSAMLRALAASLDVEDRVSFRGHVDEADLTGVYPRFDVLAVPSVPMPGWLEQFGRVVVEAQASGVPVVASASGALPEVVGDAGLLVPPRDPDALARALGRLLDEPGLWEHLRRQGLVAAQRCSWAAVADEQLELYRAAATTSR